VARIPIEETGATCRPDGSGWSEWSETGSAVERGINSREITGVNPTVSTMFLDVVDLLVLVVADGPNLSIASLHWPALHGRLVRSVP